MFPFTACFTHVPVYCMFYACFLFTFTHVSCYVYACFLFTFTQVPFTASLLFYRMFPLLLYRTVSLLRFRTVPLLRCRTADFNFRVWITGLKTPLHRHRHRYTDQDTAKYTPPCTLTLYTTLGTPRTHRMSPLLRVLTAARCTQNDAPAMKYAFGSWWRSFSGIRTVKSVVYYDAVLQEWVITKGWTNWGRNVCVVSLEGVALLVTRGGVAVCG